MSKSDSSKIVTRPAATSNAAAPRKPDFPGWGSWRLPSGESLAEFALRFGFLAPRLLGPARSRSRRFREMR